VLGAGRIAYIMNSDRFMVADDAEYDGGYSTPSAFVLWKDIRSGACRGAMSYLATAEALIAA
jgi:hypothetical protein